MASINDTQNITETSHSPNSITPKNSYFDNGYNFNEYKTDNYTTNKQHDI